MSIVDRFRAPVYLNIYYRDRAHSAHDMILKRILKIIIKSLEKN